MQCLSNRLYAHQLRLTDRLNNHGARLKMSVQITNIHKKEGGRGGRITLFIQKGEKREIVLSTRLHVDSIHPVVTSAVCGGDDEGGWCSSPTTPLHELMIPGWSHHLRCLEVCWEVVEDPHQIRIQHYYW